MFSASERAHNTRARTCIKTLLYTYIHLCVCVCVARRACDSTMHIFMVARHTQSLPLSFTQRARPIGACAESITCLNSSSLHPRPYQWLPVLCCVVTVPHRDAPWMFGTHALNIASFGRDCRKHVGCNQETTDGIRWYSAGSSLSVGIAFVSSLLGLVFARSAARNRSGRRAFHGADWQEPHPPRRRCVRAAPARTVSGPPRIGPGNAEAGLLRTSRSCG